MAQRRVIENNIANEYRQPKFEIEERYNDVFVATLKWNVIGIPFNSRETRYQHRAICHLGALDTRHYTITLSTDEDVDKRWFSLDVDLISSQNPKLTSQTSLWTLENTNWDSKRGTTALLTRKGPYRDIPVYFNDFYKIQRSESCHTFNLIIQLKFFRIASEEGERLDEVRETPLYRECRESVCEAFENLLKNESHSDVVIKINRTELHAHKCVLGARSAVFAAMFSHNCKENKQGVIDISDVDPAIFAKVLRFIYSGEIDIDEMEAVAVFIVAEKYDLQLLKKVCKRKLLLSMTDDNALELLILADLHSDKPMKAEALGYIARNLHNIKMMSDFRNFHNKFPALLDEITRTANSNDVI